MRKLRHLLGKLLIFFLKKHPLISSHMKIENEENILPLFVIYFIW